MSRCLVSPTPAKSFQVDEQQELQPLDYLAPRAYDSVCLIYRVDHHDEALRMLKTSLAHALSSFRWLAGSITNDNGRLHLTSTPKDRVAFYIQHLEHEISLNALENSGFPQESFDPAVLLPSGRWTAICPTSGTSIPVAVFQANFIKSGMLLTITWHQSCCDSTSMVHFARRWAECSASERKGVPAPKGLECKRMSVRPRTYPSNERRMTKLNESMARMKYGKASLPADLWNPGVYSVILHFRKENFDELLAKSCTESSRSRKMLLHYAIVALLYKRTIEARWRTFHASPLSTTDLSLRLDLRTAPPYINTGFGNTSINVCTEKMAIRDILNGTSHPVLASNIQRGSSSVTLGRLNEMSEWVERMSSPAEVAIKTDTAVSLNFATIDYRSWRLDELDFGFGVPRAFRHANPASNGVAMLLPARKGLTGLEVLVSLEQSSLRRLLDDWELRMFASPVLVNGGGSSLMRGGIGNDRGEGRL